MAEAEMFLPKQHLHFARVIFRGEGFPYCCVLQCLVKSVGLHASGAAAPMGERSCHSWLGDRG